MSAYWIARAKIDDPVEYKKYTLLGMRVGPSPDFKFPVFWLDIGDKDVIHVTEGGANTSANRKAYVGQQSDATRGSGVIDHFAFRCTGLAEMIEHLTGLGVPFKQRMVHDQGSYQLFLMDPNDVKVEPNFSNVEVKDVRPELVASELAGSRVIEHSLRRSWGRFAKYARAMSQ